MGASLLTGMLALAVLLSGWVAVQRAWVRSMGGSCPDADALDGRMGCRRDCGTRRCAARTAGGEEETP